MEFVYRVFIAGRSIDEESFLVTDAPNDDGLNWSPEGFVAADELERYLTEEESLARKKMADMQKMFNKVANSDEYVVFTFKRGVPNVWARTKEGSKEAAIKLLRKVIDRLMKEVSDENN